MDKFLMILSIYCYKLNSTIIIIELLQNIFQLGKIYQLSFSFAINNTIFNDDSYLNQNINMFN